MNKIKENKLQRKIRVSARIKRFSTLPQMMVFRSSKHVYAQIVDPQTSKVLASASDIKITDKKTKTEKASEVGKMIAQKAKEAGLKQVVLNRREYKYHGRIKTLSETAKQEGLVI
jgi:large subunit ribosomal protein L18